MPREGNIMWLKECIKAKNLANGKAVHATIITHGGHKTDTVLHNTLLRMYSLCGCTDAARRVFDTIQHKDVCSWTLIISSYAKNANSPQESMSLFRKMRSETDIKPNQYTYASILPACAASGAPPEWGFEVHKDLRKDGYEHDTVVATALIDMYAKSRFLDHARQVFDKMPTKDLVTWNAMLSGYSRNGMVNEAMNLFVKMPYKDQFSWSSMISGFMQNGLVGDAWKLFERVTDKHDNLVACNAMISGLAQSGCINEAYELFKAMENKDLYSWTSIIGGFAMNNRVIEAKKLLDSMPRKNAITWNAYITGLAQNGHVDEAYKAFNEMPCHDVGSWNAIISAYAQNGNAHKSMRLFQEMKNQGVKPDSRTFVTILQVCGNFAALELGMEIHNEIMLSFNKANIMVINALIDMYAKCGCIDKAKDLFDKLSCKNAASLTIMITGYSVNGLVGDAIKLFEQMGCGIVRPNHVTLSSVLSACNHAGLVDLALEIFDNMKEQYGIIPNVEHKRCIIDLLGRSGRLHEGYGSLKKLHIEGDSIAWSSLLSACRKHGDLELAKISATFLFELDPKNSASYVILSNIYASAGKWEESEKLQKIMKEKGLVKVPGCSWIEVKKQIHNFFANDRSHPDIKKIYINLERLFQEIKAVGYVPNTKSVLNDVKEEEKERILMCHSEKLAIAFGLLSTPQGSSIRIIKNLRVCVDCHEAIKYISKVTNRDIIVRDVTRYHFFKDGVCSCKEYW